MTATSTVPGLAAIGQIAMNAHDIPRAVQFYRDALGLRLLFEAPPKMAFFDCAGVRLMLSLPEREEYDHAGSVLYFRVDDIQTAYQEMMERGVHFTAAPHMIFKHESGMEEWMAFFLDPEGRPLAIMAQPTPG